MIKVKLPIKTVSEANKTGEHWSSKHKRHTAQRHAIIYMLKSEIVNLKESILPCKIIFTRIAPRKLDSDNLQSAFKTVRDQVCELITGIMTKGRGDNDERIQFEYKQEKGEPKEYAVIVEIQPT